MSLLSLYTSVVQPFLPILYELERGGIRVDGDVRKQLVADTRKELKRLERRILEQAEGYYVQWMGELEPSGAAVVAECPDHPEYRGDTKRAKCQGCAGVYGAATLARLQCRGLLAQQRARWGASIKPGGFALRSDACWRRLLFAAPPEGFGLKTSGKHKTEKLKLQKVDKDAVMEMLALNPLDSPARPLLIAKLQFDSLEHDMSNYLWTKPEGVRLKGRIRSPVDESGFAHTCYSLMTSVGRMTSGDDRRDPDKARLSDMGNLQNVPDRMRRMYVPDGPDDVLVQLDYRQMHVLLVAWAANDAELVQAVWSGADTHSEHALLLADIVGYRGLTLENADSVPFPNDPNGRSFRHWGKLAYKMLYGMMERTFSRRYGIDEKVCRRFIAAFFERRPKLRAWQGATIEEAQQQEMLDTFFGRELKFWNFDRKGRLTDKEEALAFRPIAIESDILKATSPGLRTEVAAAGGRLLTPTHDSWTANLPAASITTDVIIALKASMQVEWPEAGECKGVAGPLWCPVDVQVGRNWGKAKRGENEGGLQKWTG